MLQEIVLRNIHCATTHHACGHRYAPSLARICDTLVYAEEGTVHFSDGVKEFFVARGELLYIPAGVRGVSIFPDTLNCHRVFNFSVEGGTLFPDARVFSVSDALRALIGLCSQAGAEVIGCGVVVEKKYQGGGDAVREMGYEVVSLAKIASMSAEGGIEFCE